MHTLSDVLIHPSAPAPRANQQSSSEQHPGLILCLLYVQEGDAAAELSDLDRHDFDPQQPMARHQHKPKPFSGMMLHSCKAHLHSEDGVHVFACLLAAGRHCA